MADMYKIIEELLTQKGISGSKMCTDLGMSRSFMTELRKNRIKHLRLETAQKIADYLGVSASTLLGKEEKNPSPDDRERNVTDEEIKFARFGGDGEITDEMYEEVKRFAAYLKDKQQGRTP